MMLCAMEIKIYSELTKAVYCRKAVSIDQFSYILLI